MADKRLPLTKKAEALLEGYKQKSTRVIANLAESNALREGRNRITDADINSVKQVFPTVPGTMRKLALHIGEIVIFGLLVLQLSCLIGIQNPPLWVQAFFLIPWTAFAIWFVLILCLFRDELL
ncbi:hypothetical protein MUP79_04215 [Candidatus Bathyarchaeota archaeon]|nr:hypothetical protein [Candidatus Bathyarchaeota archaeon]